MHAKPDRRLSGLSHCEHLLRRRAFHNLPHDFPRPRLILRHHKHSLELIAFYCHTIVDPVFLQRHFEEGTPLVGIPTPHFQRCVLSIPTSRIPIPLEHLQPANHPLQEVLSQDRGQHLPVARYRLLHTLVPFSPADNPQPALESDTSSRRAFPVSWMQPFV